MYYETDLLFVCLQMTIKCKYNTVCDRSNCRYDHDTIDRKSPVINHCFFNYKCDRPDCKRIHSTLDGKSPCYLRPKMQSVNHGANITITTWNVLLDNLGLLMEKNYPMCVLDPDTRWKKIVNILETFMIKGHILCLQEVTIGRIQGVLEPICRKYSYSIIGEENCILVPPRFTVKDSNAIRVGRDTALNESKYLPNIMHSVLLCDTDHQFYVATYHMPCKYKTPSIMQAHLRQIVQIIESAKFPVVFAGDMNMFPHETNIGSGLESIWDHSPVVDTTFAYIHQEFRACIDNIFFTKDAFLYTGREITPPTYLIPDEGHPSDHVPLTCSLVLR